MEDRLLRMKISKLVKYWPPVFVWAFVIFSFSARPTMTTTEVFWQDFVVKKTAHIAEYGIFAVLLYRALRSEGIDKIKAGMWVIVIAAIYGLTDEFHQSFTPGRGPTVRDAVFDTIGATTAIIVIWKLLPKAPKRLTSWGKKLELL